MSESVGFQSEMGVDSGSSRCRGAVAVGVTSFVVIVLDSEFYDWRLNPKVIDFWKYLVSLGDIHQKLSRIAFVRLTDLHQIANDPKEQPDKVSFIVISISNEDHNEDDSRKSPKDVDMYTIIAVFVLFWKRELKIIIKDDFLFKASSRGNETISVFLAVIPSSFDLDTISHGQFTVAVHSIMFKLSIVNSAITHQVHADTMSFPILPFAIIQRSIKIGNLPFPLT